MVKHLFISMAVLSLTLISCGRNERIEERKIIPMKESKDVLTNLTPLKKSFEIQADEEAILEGEAGTIIYLPKNCLVFENGSVPRSPIQVELKECYDLSSMLGQGLHTNGLSDLLASGGMVYIQASSGGKKLKIKKGSAIQVGFPKSGNKAEMDLFYSVKGPNGKSAWIPDYKMFEFNQAPKKEVGNSDFNAPVEYPIELTEDDYHYSLVVSACSGNICDAQLSGHQKGMGIVLDYVQEPNPRSEQIAKLFYDKDWFVELEFKINEQGKMYGYKQSNHFNHSSTFTPESIKLTRDYFNSFPPFILASIDGYQKDDYYLLGIAGEREIDWQKFKVKFRKQYEASKQDASKKIKRFELDNYVFAVTEFGWINCDRFLEIPENQKTDFTVINQGDDSQNIYLIFESDTKEQSIMNGKKIKGKTIFKQVPIGRKVSVIGIGLKNGQPTLSKEKTKINKESFTLKSFKTIELSELEQALNRIP